MKMQILVVDDEIGFRDLFTYLLTSRDVEVTCVSRGEEVMGKIQEKEFHLIMLDFHLPGINGADTLSLIKKFKPDQKVIIFSSSSSPDEVLGTESIKEHAPICLFKPVELSQFQEVLRETLGISL